MTYNMLQTKSTRLTTKRSSESHSINLIFDHPTSYKLSLYLSYDYIVVSQGGQGTSNVAHFQTTNQETSKIDYGIKVPERVIIPANVKEFSFEIYFDQVLRPTNVKKDMFRIRLESLVVERDDELSNLDVSNSNLSVDELGYENSETNLTSSMSWVSLSNSNLSINKRPTGNRPRIKSKTSSNIDNELESLPPIDKEITFINPDNNLILFSLINDCKPFIKIIPSQKVINNASKFMLNQISDTNQNNSNNSRGSSHKRRGSFGLSFNLLPIQEHGVNNNSNSFNTSNSSSSISSLLSNSSQSSISNSKTKKTNTIVLQSDEKIYFKTNIPYKQFQDMVTISQINYCQINFKEDFVEKNRKPGEKNKNLKMEQVSKQISSNQLQVRPENTENSNSNMPDIIDHYRGSINIEKTQFTYTNKVEINLFYQNSLLNQSQLISSFVLILDLKPTIISFKDSQFFGLISRSEGEILIPIIYKKFDIYHMQYRSIDQNLVNKLLERELPAGTNGENLLRSIIKFNIVNSDPTMNDRVAIDENNNNFIRYFFTQKEGMNAFSTISIEMVMDKKSEFSLICQNLLKIDDHNRFIQLENVKNDVIFTRVRAVVKNSNSTSNLNESEKKDVKMVMQSDQMVVINFEKLVEVPDKFQMVDGKSNELLTEYEILANDGNYEIFDSEGSNNNSSTNSDDFSGFNNNQMNNISNLQPTYFKGRIYKHDLTKSLELPINQKNLGNGQITFKIKFKNFKKSKILFLNNEIEIIINLTNHVKKAYVGFPFNNSMLLSIDRSAEKINIPIFFSRRPGLDQTGRRREEDSSSLDCERPVFSPLPSYNDDNDDVVRFDKELEQKFMSKYPVYQKMPTTSTLTSSERKKSSGPLTPLSKVKRLGKSLRTPNSTPKITEKFNKFNHNNNNSDQIKNSNNPYISSKKSDLSTQTPSSNSIYGKLLLSNGSEVLIYRYMVEGWNANDDDDSNSNSNPNNDHQIQNMCIGYATYKIDLRLGFFKSGKILAFMKFFF